MGTTAHAQRRRAESYTWPLVAIALIIAPQLLIPASDRVGPPLAVPLIETCAFLVMLTIAARPGPVPPRTRPLMLSLFGVLAAANAAAAFHLVAIVLDVTAVHQAHLTANRLLIAGALVLATNVVTFGLLYWQLDGGGPAGRVRDPAPYPDFQFPQTSTPGLADPRWRPQFADHLYVAFTNVIAFSPTDTMPLTRRAKGLMAVQSLISVAVLVVVLARVINILPT